jgi:hypothetical protein
VWQGKDLREAILYVWQGKELRDVCRARWTVKEGTYPTLGCFAKRVRKLLKIKERSAEKSEKRF